MRRTLLATLAFCFIAGPALAAGGPPADPPPPADGEAATLERWVDDNVLQSPYILAGIGSDRAVLFEVSSVAMEGGQLRATVRGELFKPAAMQGAAARSFRDRWAFDCAGQRFKVLTSELFPQSNLQGRAVPFDTSKEAFVAPTGDGEVRLMAQVCSVGSLLKPGVDLAKARPPDLLAYGDEATEAWLKRYIVPGKYRFAYGGTGVGVYYDPAAAKAESGRPLVWIRTELSVALPAEKSVWRSMREQTELDCAHWRYHRAEQEIYPGSNLTGDVWRRAGDSFWSEAVPGGTEAKWMQPVCAAVAPHPRAAPPASAQDAAAVRRWIDANLNLNGAVLVGTTDGGVIFYQTDQLALQPDGHVLATARIEQFAPRTVDGDTVRSITQRFEFDCQGRRQRIVGTSAYAENNLGGSSFSDDSVLEWMAEPPQSNGAIIQDEACAQVSLLGPDVDPSLAMPTPPFGTSDADLKAWIRDNIDTTDYADVVYSADSLMTYDPKSLQRSGDTVRAAVRVELFRPRFVDGGVQRSVRALTEFDCAQKRTRQLSADVYPGANLLGAKQPLDPSQHEWKPVGEGTLDSELAAAVCAAKS